ncbi:hypothetical protein AKJ16_DCAP05812 [Drosera capensis]
MVKGIGSGNPGERESGMGGVSDSKRPGREKERKEMGKRQRFSADWKILNRWIEFPHYLLARCFTIVVNACIIPKMAAGASGWSQCIKNLDPEYQNPIR